MLGFVSNLVAITEDFMQIWAKAGDQKKWWVGSLGKM